MSEQLNKEFQAIQDFMDDFTLKGEERKAALAVLLDNYVAQLKKEKGLKCSTIVVSMD